MYTTEYLLKEYTKDQLVAMANYYGLDTYGKLKKDVAELVVVEMNKEEQSLQASNVQPVEEVKYSVRVKRIMESKNELV